MFYKLHDLRAGLSPSLLSNSINNVILSW